MHSCRSSRSSVCQPVPAEMATRTDVGSAREMGWLCGTWTATMHARDLLSDSQALTARQQALRAATIAAVRQRVAQPLKNASLPARLQLRLRIHTLSNCATLAAASHAGATHALLGDEYVLKILIQVPSRCDVVQLLRACCRGGGLQSLRHEQPIQSCAELVHA